MHCVFFKVAAKILLFQLALSYSNKTIFQYEFPPTDTCDPVNPWNQSAFGGLEHPLYIQILEHTGWNLSEIAFYCIYSDGEVYKAFNTPTRFNHYIGTLNGWLTVPITYPWQCSQPYHEIIIEAVASYDTPSWIIFQRFDFRILILLFSAPFIIGILLHFLNEKQSRYYQASDYFGLIFFQQEIIGRRNISAKIISLAIQLVSLIIMGIFTYELQESFKDMQTYGGRTIESGLQGVKVYTNGLNMYRAMAATLMIPISNGALYLSPDEWMDFIVNHTGSTFLVEIQMALPISYKDCSVKLIGDIFNVANVVHLGHETRQESSQLNAAIVDTMEFRHDYYPEYNITDILDANEIKCSTAHKTIFQYSINDFYQLWVIYAVGVGIATLGKVINYLKFIKNKRDLGVLHNRTNKICRKTANLCNQSFMWLQIYQKHFTYRVFAEKFRHIRKHLINKNPEWVQNLKKARSKVALNHMKRTKRNKFLFRVLASLFVQTVTTPKFKKIAQKSVLKLPSYKIWKLSPKFEKSTSMAALISKQKRKYIISIIENALEASFIDALRIFEICKIDHHTKLHEYIKSKGFHKDQMIGMKEKPKVKYMVEASMHIQLKKLFFEKIISFKDSSWNWDKKIKKTQSSAEEVSREQYQQKSWGSFLQNNACNKICVKKSQYTESCWKKSCYKEETDNG